MKSGDASIAIPELGFESGFGTLGAVYTTVEGLLNQTKENMMKSQFFQMGLGDSATDETKQKFKDFLQRLDDVIDGKVAFTIILKDPTGNSWVYSPLAPKPDPQIDIVDYERPDSENEMLGLNQMDTEECDRAEKLAD